MHSILVLSSLISSKNHKCWEMGQLIRGHIQRCFFVLSYFLQVIFEDMYVGLVQSVFVALRINYYHLILEHVSSSSISKGLASINIADLLLFQNWLALTCNASRESKLLFLGD